MKLVKVAAGAAVGLLVIALGAHAQGYPSRPVRALIGFPAGGAVDITARVVAQKLAELWMQPVVVDNRPGAGGSIAAGIVARAAPDGYTLLVHSKAFAINPAFYSGLGYDPANDFAAIGSLGSSAFVLVVGPSSDAKTVAELVSAAKKRPGQLHYGSAGVGSSTHLAAETFRLATGIDAVHVPYKGGGPAITADTMTGRIAYWFAPVLFAMPYLRDGRLVALGLSGPKRSGMLPSVPTIAETGVPGFDFRGWDGIWVPAATPAAVVDKIARDVARSLAVRDVTERLANLGIEPMSVTPAEFARFVRSEIEVAARIVKAAGIQPQ